MPQIFFLSAQEVIKIHIVQIESFGGIHGIRDLGLLESAIATPKAQFQDTFLHKNIFEMAAAYMYHIIKNHPFLDGNKRTGMAAGLIFFHTNGYELPWSNQEIYKLGCAIATASITKDQVATLLAAHWS